MRTTFLTVTVSLSLLAACATTPAAPPAAEKPAAADPAALVAAADRTDADRALDAGRHPAEFLAFLALQPGMKVGEIGAGGGYTTELLGRAVAPTGVVFGQNTPGILAAFAEKPWSERVARPVNQGRIIRVDREFDSPFPPGMHDLDAVVSNAIYHDTVWLAVDRAKMNKAIFDALKPGGIYVVADSSAKAGTGVQDVKTLHRIDEAVVKAEVLAAGFENGGASPALRNPADTRDWSASPGAAKERRGTGDRFVLRFIKPGKAPAATP